MNDGNVVSAVGPARRIPETFLCLAEALFMCESSRMGRSPGGLPFRRVACVRHGRRRQGVWTDAPSLNNLNEPCRALTLRGAISGSGIEFHDHPPNPFPENCQLLALRPIRGQVAKIGDIRWIWYHRLI